jgi:hypothetical protein|tara:strand:+ start:217 stop:702 length:486 start_codon:yes stop_codon:yes gene_type:complete
MTPITDLLGNDHLVKSCTADDIPLHYSKVVDFIPEDERVSYYSRMVECVELSTAFALSDDSCFLYYKKEDVQPKFAHGVSFYGVGNPLKTMALLLCIFTKIDTKTFVMKFQPHTGKFVSEYKSILTVASIKRHNMNNSYLVSRIDVVKKKILSLYKKRGIL